MKRLRFCGRFKIFNFQFSHRDTNVSLIILYRVYQKCITIVKFIIIFYILNESEI